jgi:hypothetical protein
MLNTLTVDGWCVLPVLFPLCHRRSSNLNLLQNVIGGWLDQVVLLSGDAISEGGLEREIEHKGALALTTPSTVYLGAKHCVCPGDLQL